MAAQSSESRGPARIMIWSPPRSVSTAFARSMSARGDTEMFWEPYLTCHYLGPERDKPSPFEEFIGSMVNDKYTHKYINSLLQADYADVNVVFVKDMIEGIRKNFDVVERGYRHSLLIRNPRKSFGSLVRMYNKFFGPSKTEALIVDRFSVIYHDMERFYDHVKMKLDQGAPPIIDADDLVQQPEKILPKYCEAMGIEYTPKMLEWKSVDETKLNWHFLQSNIEQADGMANAMKGTSFGKVAQADVELSPVIEDIISRAMPVYERLYALRIKP